MIPLPEPQPRPLAVALALLVLLTQTTWSQSPPQPRATSQVRVSGEKSAAKPEPAKSGISLHIADSSAGSVRSAARLREPTAVGSALPEEVLPKEAHQVLELIQFDDVALAEAMRLFAEQSGLNVVTSSEAGRAKITVYLKNVTALAALEAIVKTNGLFYRVDEDSGIIRIATLSEYEKDLASFREEQTRVFTLLYPNPSAVAQVIQQVFGNRVQMHRADADVEDLIDLSRRFNRFDLVDGRSLGLGGTGGRNGNNSSNSTGGLGRNGLGRAAALGMGGGLAGVNGLTGMGAQGGMMNSGNTTVVNNDQEPLNDLSADEIQRLENEVAANGQLSEENRADLLQRKEATIYVSTIRRNNQVIVRTGDARSMEQIAQLIAQLDVPTPTVLLEVKVLRIVLAEGFNSAFEYFGGSGKISAASSDGSIGQSFPGASTVSRTLASGLGVAGSVPGALTFQMVDHNFRLRMQVLESKNCVTALATPLILTANNEVSRIFVGDTLPFTVGFTPSQVLSSVGSVNGAVAATPITELRDVGQSLLITPNINADRTVTLRVVEENSERVLGGSSIPVPATSGTGVTNVNVDTVRRRTISGTIVAQDGMAVALGGLIEENASDARDQLPVLGNIPGLGMLFRRQATNRSRSELVVIVRPYVFNTPSESAATSELLLGELSTHPKRSTATGTLNKDMPCRVTRSDAECGQRAKLFQFHHAAYTAQ
ncbi:MAG: type II secretion system protein GspD [Aureliella sp.]